MRPLAALLLAVLVALPAASQSDDPCPQPDASVVAHETGPVLDRHRRAVARLDPAATPSAACLDARAAAVASTTTEIRQAWRSDATWTDRTRIDRAFDDAGRRTEETVATRTVGDWENERRTLSAYPGDDLVLTFEAWNGSEWVPSSRSSYFYRSDQRSTGSRIEAWIAATGQWRTTDQTTIAYDAEGRQTAVTLESWDGSALAPVQRSLTGRDGSVATVVFEIWTGAGWRAAARTTFTDDATGRPLERLDELRVGEAWVPDVRTVYTYAVVTEILSQQWEAETWVNAARTLVQSDGVTETRTTETWADQAWAGLDRVTTTRDADGRLTQSVSEVWEGSGYVNSRRLRREYTGATLTSESHDRWDPPSDHWWYLSTTRVTLNPDGQPIETEDLTYFTPGNVTSGARTTSAYDAAGQLATRTRETYDRETQTWENEERTRFIDNGPVAVDMGPTTALTVSVRPNPVAGEGTVRVEVRGSVRVDVLDVLGRRVAVLADGPLAAPSLSLPELAPGTYVVRATAGGQTVTQTITVVR